MAIDMTIHLFLFGWGLDSTDVYLMAWDQMDMKYGVMQWPVACSTPYRFFNKYTLRPRQNSRHFADDIFNRIFVNENVIISIKFSLKFVPKGPINNIPALVQIMDWRRPGDKPLSEPVMVSLLTLICVTRPQWVNWLLWSGFRTTHFSKWRHFVSGLGLLFGFKRQYTYVKNRKFFRSEEELQVDISLPNRCLYSTEPIYRGQSLSHYKPLQTIIHHYKTVWLHRSTHKRQECLQYPTLSQ